MNIDLVGPKDVAFAESLAVQETSSVSVPGGAAAAEPAKGPYPPPADQPTQLGPQDIRFDYNFGARVVLPTRTAGKWRLRLHDLDTGNTLFQTENQGAFVSSAKRYYVRIGIEVSEVDDAGAVTEVLSHAYDAGDREVLIQFPAGTIGDTVGWLPYAVKFQQAHRCRLTCAMADRLIPLFADAYPEITFTALDAVDPTRFYATYRMGLFFDDKECVNQPCDFRFVGLHRTAGYILGVDPTEMPPRLAVADDSRPIAEPYVCIAVQASTYSKCWINPTGWHEVVRFLKDAGYRVVCIDQKPVHGTGIVWNHIPHGVEDETGDRPLTERVRWLKHAAFFVGLSSGLSWLAWASGTPVVLVSGFTHPTNEFATPYRVINYHACNSCWNDPAVRFNHHDYLWCPRHANTPRQFECTRLITAAQVTQAIERIPAYLGRQLPDAASEGPEARLTVVRSAAR